jgi:hypothetical protein
MVALVQQWEDALAFLSLVAEKSCEECPVWGAKSRKAAGSVPAAFLICWANIIAPSSGPTPAGSPGRAVGALYAAISEKSRSLSRSSRNYLNAGWIFGKDASLCFARLLSLQQKSLGKRSKYSR